MLIRIRKAQASLEYAALIGVVVGAIILMSTYMKRSMQGNLRSASDEIGDQYDFDDGGYFYSSTLNNQEVTYSVTGTTDGDYDVGAEASWVNSDAAATDIGVMAQWTETPGSRTVREQVANVDGRITE